MRPGHQRREPLVRIAGEQRQQPRGIGGDEVPQVRASRRQAPRSGRRRGGRSANELRQPACLPPSRRSRPATRRRACAADVVGAAMRPAHEAPRQCVRLSARMRPTADSTGHLSVSPLQHRRAAAPASRRSPGALSSKLQLAAVQTRDRRRQAQPQSRTRAAIGSARAGRSARPRAARSASGCPARGRARSRSRGRPPRRP